MNPNRYGVGMGAINPNQRGVGESFGDFRERRSQINFLWRTRRRRYPLLWDSSTRGTYVRAKHGDLLPSVQ